MPKVNISEAAKLANITRQHLYKKYINTGIISVEQDRNGNKQIDTSEIMRVFGAISVDSKQTTNNLHDFTINNNSKNDLLEKEVQLLREQLQGAVEREKWLQGKIDQLTDQLTTTTRLLEHKPPDPTQRPKGKKWWQF